ncbi:MAG: DUF2867 domain-containing protein [Desulfuromonas sp.]|nr:MAG: DUF2867 domain-containing protein [Desulfuromonas sp.]
MTRKDDIVLVAGATGYIGGRLIPALLEAGYRVRALARVPGKISSRPWANDPNLEIVQGDLLDVESLPGAVRGCRAVYYLVHSMVSDQVNFAETDRKAAENMAAAADKAGMKQIIYLAGLGNDDSGLSHHLRSRREVENCLKKGKVPVTVLRAAMIIGSGSASFEILRYLVERLPVMITPRWIDTQCQPIAVRNVLNYLVGCLSCPATIGETFDIGQENVTTYRQMMQIFAEEAGLRKRLIIPVPVLTPRLSSYWIHLVTPVPASLARPLAEGLSNPVICQDMRIREILPQTLYDCRQAIRLALAQTRDQQIESSWIDAGTIPPVEWARSGDPEWAGGTRFYDSRRIVFDAPKEDVWQAILKIGGANGWYYADWLWQVRGFIDRLVGGVGLQRGRRCPLVLAAGDSLDFWRVLNVEEMVSLQLVAEMKLPGEATLGFSIKSIAPGQTALTLTARYCPRGLFGILYWYLVLPFHGLVFNGMLYGIGKRLDRDIVAGPEKISLQGL